MIEVTPKAVDAIADVIGVNELQAENDRLRTRIAALVEAARPFDLNVNPQLPDLHPMRARHSAREYRALSEALRGFGR